MVMINRCKGEGVSDICHEVDLALRIYDYPDYQTRFATSGAPISRPT